MKIAGGVIAIIAGVFGIVAAVVTLFIGGVGAALESEGSQSVIGVGWAGILFAFLTIIFGAIAIGAKTRKPAIALLLCAVVGAITGGTFVAICMALAIVGGILAVIPSPSPATAAPHPPVESVTRRTGGRNWKIWAGSILGIVVILGFIGAIGSRNQSPSTTSEKSKELAGVIGQPIATDKFEITVMSLGVRKSLGGEYINATPAEGAIYVTVQWKYKNISKKPIGSFSTPRIKLVDANGIEYDTDANASGMYATEVKTDEKILSNLNPGLTVTAADAYEISRDSLANPGWELLIDADRDITVPFEFFLHDESTDGPQVLNGTFISVDLADKGYLTVRDSKGENHIFTLGETPGIEELSSDAESYKSATEKYSGKKVRVIFEMRTIFEEAAKANITRTFADRVEFLE